MIRLRAFPWWALALAALLLLLALGAVADGYVFRFLGAILKCATGLALGYYAHRHLVMQGRRLLPDDDSPAAQGKRISRAILMGACALTVGMAV